MTADAPLDPDQITCRKCAAAPGDVCRMPNGDRARTIHLARRRDALNGTPPTGEPATVPRGSTRRGGKPASSSTFTSETAAAASRKASQERKRRAAEAAAAREEARTRLEREALEDEAVKLAEDALRWERDRALLRRRVLTVASKAFERLEESLDGLQVVKLDDEGRPETTTVEREDQHGRPRNVTIPDVRGAYSAATVERLAKVAASALQNVRLEEGKATAIAGQDSSVADALGEAGVEELLEYARKNLPGSKG